MRMGYGRRIKCKIGKKEYSFASKQEMYFAQRLHERGLTWEYETVKIKWLPKSIHTLIAALHKIFKGSKAKQLEDMASLLSEKFQHTYTPDFIITKRDKSLLFIETKGRFTGADRTKMQAVKYDHPDLDIRMIFFGKGTAKLSKGAKTTYGEWCNKSGYLWMDSGELPKEWLLKNG